MSLVAVINSDNAVKGVLEGLRCFFGVVPIASNEEREAAVIARKNKRCALMIELQQELSIRGEKFEIGRTVSPSFCQIFKAGRRRNHS